MKKIILALAISLPLFLSMGCGPSQVTVGARMDAPYYERPVRPGPDYVWIDGDWYYRNGRYEYHQGYCERPRRSRIWISGTWTTRNNGYYWRKGRWQRR